jgi:hypothetical protein
MSGDSTRPRLVLVAVVTLVTTAVVVLLGTTGPSSVASGQASGYEVWLIDQEGKDRLGDAGTLYIFDGEELTNDAATAVPETINLGSAVASFCYERTGTTPARPHMLVFNGGDSDAPSGNTDAVIAYVGSGHVAFLDAATREPVECIDVGTQAHAAWPTPDQRHLIVANQNGKKLQRIATDYANNHFTLEDDATIDLAACTTPSRVPCQDPERRPDNAPICPRTTRDGALTFVTLRGGGMFVVDHNTTPMRIVAEYDRDTVDDNGCGEMEAAGRMYVNSGAGVTDPPVPGDEPYGHDVYSFELDQFGTTPSTTPNWPSAELVYTRDLSGAKVDAHAVALTKHGTLWWGDRVENDVTVVDPRLNRVVSHFPLDGELSDDPAPDLFDLSPDGAFVFTSLRGPNPATGHDAVGTTPGLGVIKVRAAGLSGRLTGVARVGSVRGTPDPHAIRVRARG